MKTPPEIKLYPQDGRPEHFEVWSLTHALQLGTVAKGLHGWVAVPYLGTILPGTFRTRKDAVAALLGRKGRLAGARESRGYAMAACQALIRGGGPDAPAGTAAAHQLAIDLARIALGIDPVKD